MVNMQGSQQNPSAKSTGGGPRRRRQVPLWARARRVLAAPLAVPAPVFGRSHPRRRGHMTGGCGNRGHVDRFRDGAQVQQEDSKQKGAFQIHENPEW
jgi:hypothetical protein